LNLDIGIEMNFVYENRYEITNLFPPRFVIIPTHGNGREGNESCYEWYVFVCLDVSE